MLGMDRLWDKKCLVLLNGNSKLMCIIFALGFTDVKLVEWIFVRIPSDMKYDGIEEMSNSAHNVVDGHGKVTSCEL